MSFGAYTTAKQAILITDLLIFAPLAILEIALIQRCQSDKLFKMTAAFYITCFSMRIINSFCFQGKELQDNFGLNFLSQLVQLIQKSACLALTYYILLIEFVKITLQSESPKLLMRSQKIHKKMASITIAVLFGLIVIEAILGLFNNKAAECIIESLYMILVIYVTGKFLLTV